MAIGVLALSQCAAFRSPRTDRPVRNACQFKRSAWEELGFAGNPADASIAAQNQEFAEAYALGGRGAVGAQRQLLAPLDIELGRTTRGGSMKKRNHSQRWRPTPASSRLHRIHAGLLLLSPASESTANPGTGRHAESHKQASARELHPVLSVHDMCHLGHRGIPEPLPQPSV